MKRPSARDVSRWYDRLRAEGFQDVEMRRANDGTWYEGPSTYAHGEVSLGDGEIASEGWEGRESLSDAPVAVHFRTLAAAAHEMAQELPRCGALMVDYAETGDLLNSARRLGWSYRAARTVLDAFLAHVEQRRRGWSVLLELQVAVAELDGQAVAA